MTSPIAMVSLLVLASAAPAEETLREISWSQLEEAGQLQAGLVVPASDETSFEHLKVVCPPGGGEMTTVNLFTITGPGVTRLRYAVTGKVRCEGLKSAGYLEMWNHFPDGGMYFSRTLGDSGPLQSLEGSCDWRTFVVPFYIDEGSEQRPSKLEFNVVLPGSGTVELSPLRLVQYTAPAANPMAVGTWWSDETGGWLGGILGTVLGCMGGLIGWLSARGRARRLVVGMMKAMMAVGAAALISGVAALVQSQPYGVYYPLLLLGILCSVVPASLLPVVRRRFEQLELRRMSAVDVP